MKHEREQEAEEYLLGNEVMHVTWERPDGIARALLLLEVDPILAVLALL